MNTSQTTALEKIWRRLQMALGVGRITTGNDSGLVQMHQVKLTGNDVRDNTARVVEYGFTSMPKPGCQALLIFVAGDRSNGVIVGTNDETARLKNLEPGEVAIYDDQGQTIWIKRGGIEIDGAGKPILIHNTPTITMKADTSITLDTPLVHHTGNSTVDQLLTTQNFTMLAGGAATWGVGGAGTMAFNNMTVTYTGGSITHNGKFIDSTEVHSGVFRGTDNSGPTA